MKEKGVMRRRKSAAIAMAIWLGAAPAASASELTPATLATFAHYVALSESRMAADDSAHAGFLWIERLPEPQRSHAFALLRNGEIVIERLETLENGKPIAVPGGMIHHWTGTIFIPGVTLQQTLALMQDYNHHQEYYKPDVVRSKILKRDGNDFDVELRFHKKKIITSVIETEHEVHYLPIDATHEESISKSTHIHEVESPGEADEKLKPEGNDRGLLWRIFTYWRFEEKDGGTYVESQSISLTRDIPAAVAWLVRGYVESVPRESLRFTLEATRSALLHQPPPAHGD
ncbi:MAG: hypothetical protein ACRD50_03740 [Candidatus Acidiferrales bacterium]